MSKGKDILPELQVNKRRHSATYGKPQQDIMGLLPTFNTDKMKTGNRRHSMMVMPNSMKRSSIDIRLTEDQRRSLQLPRYSQVFGYATFSGLPLVGYKEPVVQYENNYKMEPDKKFQAHLVQQAVEKVIDDILDWDDDILTDDKPDPKGKSEKIERTHARHKRRAKVITKIVEEVKDEVKQLEFTRF